MRKVIFALLAVATIAFAANIRLFLKDGSYQLVREYKVESDRVNFYSVERSQWEEVPLALVDLKRTEEEQSERKAVIEKEAKAIAEEDAAQVAVKEEVAKIPQEPGVYYVENGQVKSLKLAESKVHNNKGRNVLKVMAPIPVVTGKATLETDGAHAANLVANPAQEFYIELANEERFGIIRLKPEHDVRIVEKITIAPVTKEIFEEPDEVQIFRKQMNSESLFKIWPMKALAPGEYAVVEYTLGKVNMQVWDFAVGPQ
jgi:hypothetical protein